MEDRSTQEEQPHTVRDVVRAFVVHNPLFLMSALLALGGAWLTNPPEATGGRSLVLLLKLFFVLQLYEASLLGAAYVLRRRPQLSRDVRNLALVLAPFLVDATFTNATLTLGLAQHAVWVAVLFAAAVFGITGLKMWFAARATGQRFVATEWAVLMAAPLVVALDPLMGFAILSVGIEASVLGGIALSGVAVLYAATAAGDSDQRETVRRLAPIALLALGFHLRGAIWSPHGDLTLLYGPVLLILGPTLPMLLWPSFAGQDDWTPFLLPLVGAYICTLGGTSFGWVLGLSVLAILHGAYAVRHGGIRFVLGTAVALYFLLGGDPEKSQAVDPLLLGALYLFALWRRAPAPVTLCLLVLAAFAAADHVPVGAPFDAMLCTQLAGVGLLLWTHRTHGVAVAGLPYRSVGALLVCVPPLVVMATASGEALTTARALGWATMLPLAILGIGTRCWEYLVAAPLFPLELVIRLGPANGGGGWGGLGLGLAFIAVGCGVALSLNREHVLAWLDLPPPDGGAEGTEEEQPG
ncbi:hypothetical protein ACFL59_16195 [Planctomycetota bacterium]